MKKQLKKNVKKIERIRDYMHDLIRKKGSLTDPEVVLVSQRLDWELNKYSKLFD
ncbi:aspartyl-phosphate phosphatase Spo0E family protein [Clostridium magnum]|uniref:Spo0E like sporulation regulatory protein n=1 Tax=Clostridium magnum DSM 2767 TaxID=1121326 RepID=A0A161YS07_9CLOT|nr:aspartyl-phosphate phosphatase Spo0E family protein [Clostridium magnum]KZL93792.1 Spo0E like sporulation regulatory protein [Clostridium magnum DSM 2767]SHI08806.1 Spo0E like sporulation regulatory protein [Clostridium magnum DSM 2767]